MIHFARLQKYWSGRCCISCQKYQVSRLSDKRVFCRSCGKRYSLSRLKRELTLLWYFSLEISAHRTSKETAHSYNTVRSAFMRFRQAIAKHEQQTHAHLAGQIELDESYFGGKRKGKRGRGAAGKVAVFGMLERNGTVFAVAVSDVSASTLMDLVSKHTQKGSVYHTDTFRSYRSINRYGKHLKIDHSKEFRSGPSHINGLEGFWSYAKERFHKYHGVSRDHFFLYLKELEFRYNERNQNIFKLLVNIIFTPKFN